MIRVDQQDDIRLSNLLAQGVSLLREGGGVDDGGGDIFWRPDGGRNGNLRQDGLDLVRHEDIFDEGSDEAGLSGALVAADADAHCWASLMLASMCAPSSYHPRDDTAGDQVLTSGHDCALEGV